MRTVDVALDLRRATVHLPALVLTKQAGQPGTVVRATGAARRAEPAGRAGSGRGGRLAGRRRGRARPGAHRRPSASCCGGCARRWATSPPTCRWMAVAGAAASISAGSTCDRCYRQAAPAAAAIRPCRILDLRISAQPAPPGRCAVLAISTGSIERRGGIWQAAKLRANIEDSTVSLDVRHGQRSRPPSSCAAATPAG